MERGTGSRRAQRFGVTWPVRVRRVNEAQWHAGRTLNLSVTGALIRTYRRFRVGEDVEVEIEFLAHAERKAVVSSLAHVVREESAVPRVAAIHFVSAQSDFAGILNV